MREPASRKNFPKNGFAPGRHMLANAAWAVSLSLGCVLIATLARMALEPVIGHATPFITMFPATAVAAILGGALSGMLAAVLGALAAWFFRVPPAFTFNVLAQQDLGGLAFYLLGALLIVASAAAMRRAMHRLEEAQEKLYAALEASNTGTWRWDVQRDMVEWDLALGKLYDLPPERWPRNSAEFFALVLPEDRERARRIVESAARGETAMEYEFRIPLPDGSVRWLYNRSRTVLDKEGRVRYMIGACVDVTERKCAEERQTLLLHELNHRVKNTLATVQALVSQTLRSERGSEGFEAAFMPRLMALSATHDILTQTMWESALLGDVLSAELRPHGGADGRRIVVNGCAVRLKPQQALSLGMAFHELATNAAKYGALSNENGVVEVTWMVAGAKAGEQELMLHWQERGGPGVVAAGRLGFGLRLIDRSITHELGGSATFDFAPDGLDCRIRVPLNTVAGEHS